MVTHKAAETLPMFEMFCSSENILCTSCTSQDCDDGTRPLLPNLRFIICQVIAYGKLKTKEKFKLLVLKVAAVALERWSLTGCFYIFT